MPARGGGLAVNPLLPSVPHSAFRIPPLPRCLLCVLCGELLCRFAFPPFPPFSAFSGSSALKTPRSLGIPRYPCCFFVKCEICPPNATYVRPREVMHIKVCT